jgi:RNA polymerase sigma factor (sigma-70 family)
MAVTETGHLASREVDELYRRHGGEVYRYAYAVLGNHADAEDITQTTFLNAYRSLEQGVRPRKPSNWLLTIASNAIKQRFRHEQARPHQVELDDRIAGSEVEDDGPTVGELLTALAKIPPQQRQAIVLREFEGRSYSEIAGILGVTTSALETLLFRARRSLAEELEHQLSCTEAQHAISRAVDGRLGRKERRRLRDHLVECPDCATFARLQRQHRSALRGLLLVPIPLSLTILKGLQSPGAATAATVPATAATGAGVTALGAGGIGATTVTGGGLLAGGVALKAAAVVAAVSVAGGAAIGASKLESGFPNPKSHASTPKPGKHVGQVAPRGVLVPGNGVARGKAAAPGQTRRTIVHAAHTKKAAAHARSLGHSRAHHAHPKGRSSSAAATSHPMHRPSHTHSSTTKSTKTAKSTPPKQTPKKPSGQAPTAAPSTPAPAPATSPTTTPNAPVPPPADPTQAHGDSGNHNGTDTGSVTGNGNANGNDKG